MKLHMLILGLAFLLLNAGYSAAQDSTEAKAAESTESAETTAPAETEDAVKYCLICGPEEETETLSLSYKYKGKKYSFCSMDCLKSFKKDPEKYFNAENPADVEEKHSDQDGHKDHTGHDHSKENSK